MNPEAIIPIIEDYLEGRRLKKPILDSEYKKRLSEIGIEEERLNDIILKMDDEWTKDDFLRARYKRAITSIYGGYFIGATALTITILSATGILFNGQTFVFFYGAIAAGFVAGIWGQASISSIKQEKENRKFFWKSWVK